MRIDISSIIVNVEDFRKAIGSGFTLYLLAIVIYVASTFLWAFRWYIILRRLGSRVSYTNIYIAIMGGILFNNITPSLKFGGEGFRAGWLRVTEKVPTERSILSIAYERVTEIPGVAMVLAMAIVGGLGGVVHTSFNPHFVLVPGATLIAIKIREKFEAVRIRLKDDMRNLLRDWELTFTSALISLFIWIQDIARFYLIAASVGVNLTVSEAAILSLGYLLLGMGPTPAGIGFVEGGLVSILAALGVSLERAGLIVIGERLISSVLASLIGFILVVLKGGIKLFREVARIAREEEVVGESSDSSSLGLV